MNSFSLLQTSLDQTISRQELEDSSAVVPSVARADCTKMQQEMFGVLASGLTREGAEGFQSVLSKRGFETQVVLDHDLPVLHDSYQIRRLGKNDDVVIMTNTMGQELGRPLEEMVFAAAGYIDGGRFGREPRFRVDLFYSSSPNRVHLSLSDDTVIFYEGALTRLKDRERIRSCCDQLATWLPSERLNKYLANRSKHFVYPTIQCYEEELRWHFYQLTPRG